MSITGPGEYDNSKNDFMTVMFVEILMLVTALSADAFAAGLAYGAGGTRIPPVSLLTASAVSSIIFSVSILAGRLAGDLLPGQAVKAAGFLLLAGLGLWKVFSRSSGEEAEKADKNRDRRVSPLEALTLGTALSADSLAAGAGAGALRMPLAFAVSASFLAGAAALFLGETFGGRLSGFRRKDGRSLNFNRLGGVLLLLLAAVKLI